MNKNFFLELYGSETKSSKKTTVAISSIFLAIAVALFIWASRVELIPALISGYFGTLSFSLAFFVVTSYFYTKKEKKDSYMTLKKLSFFASLILFCVCILPITFVNLLSGKIKFDYFFKYNGVYLFTLFIPLLASVLMAYGALSFILNNISFFSSFPDYINYVTVGCLLFCLIWRILTFLTLYFFRWCYKMTSAEYKSIKKDFNILFFAEITSVTIFTNCIILSELDKILWTGITSAFSIYLAIDCLKTKWTFYNEKLEQELKESQQ